MPLAALAERPLKRQILQCNMVAKTTERPLARGLRIVKMADLSCGAPWRARGEIHDRLSACHPRAAGR